MPQCHLRLQKTQKIMINMRKRRIFSSMNTTVIIFSFLCSIDSENNLTLTVKTFTKYRMKSVVYFLGRIKRAPFTSRVDIRADLNLRQTNIQRSDKSALRYCLHLGTTSIYGKSDFSMPPPNDTRGPTLCGEIF